MNYFVSVNGTQTASNLSKEIAINKAKVEYNNGNTSVGIGKIKIVKGKKVYTLLPLYFYVD
jgi:ribosomal protein L9